MAIRCEPFLYERLGRAPPIACSMCLSSPRLLLVSASVAPRLGPNSSCLNLHCNVLCLTTNYKPALPGRLKPVNFHRLLSHGLSTAVLTFICRRTECAPAVTVGELGPAGPKTAAVNTAALVAFRSSVCAVPRRRKRTRRPHPALLSTAPDNWAHPRADACQSVPTETYPSPDVSTPHHGILYITKWRQGYASE